MGFLYPASLRRQQLATGTLDGVLYLAAGGTLIVLIRTNPTEHCKTESLILSCHSDL